MWVRTPKLAVLSLRAYVVSQAVVCVSRRRLDQADFDPQEVNEDGLPLVYNEQRIASFWKGKPDNNCCETSQVTLYSPFCKAMCCSLRGTHLTLGTF